MAVDLNNKVTVTARDIEFDNFTSSTGKWNSATMTLMVLDNETEGLQEYDEKLVAVFKKHGTNETVSFSSVIDGVDTRITTTDALDPLAKYELDGIYGEDTEQEYTTTSKFYFQVPGKKWNFANDTVSGDVKLVSDWHNYGYIKDTNDVIHGVTNPSEFVYAVSRSSNVDTFTVNGVTMTRTDVKGVKYSSMMDEDLNATGLYSSNRSFLYGYDNLEEVDVVSCKLTRLFPDNPNNVLADNTVSSPNLVYCLSGSKFNQRVAFPETLVVFSMISGNGNFTQPVYIPPSVKQICNSFYSFTNVATYDKKVVFSPNIYKIAHYNFKGLKNWNHSLNTLSANIQLRDGDHSNWFMNGVGINKPYTIPSTWTYIPLYFMGSWEKFAQELVIPDNITEIHGNGQTTMNGLNKCTGLTFSKNLVSLTETKINGLGRKISDSDNFTYIKKFQDTKITETPTEFLRDSSIDFSYFGFPNTLTNIKNGFMDNSKWKNLPVDEDGYDVFEIPEGITHFGGFNSIDVRNKKLKLVLPSTIQSVDGSIMSKCVGKSWLSTITPYVKVDLSKVDPSVWRDEGTSTSGSFTVDSSTLRYMPVEITVASGTVDAWKAKIPDIPDADQEGHYYRKIVWEEQTLYGRVYYKENPTDTEELYVDLESANDLNKLCGNGRSSYQHIVATINGVTLDNGFLSTTHQDYKNPNATNVITGFEFGIEQVNVPNYFLYSCVYIENRDMVVPENARLGGSNGIYFMGSCVNFVGKLTFKNTNFIDDKTPTYLLARCSKFNSPLSLPDSVEEIGHDFLLYCFAFDSQLTLPNNLVTISDNFMRDCRSFDKDIVFPDSVTTIGSYFMYYCTSFTRPITFGSGISSIDGKYFMGGCDNFVGPMTVNCDALTDYDTSTISVSDSTSQAYVQGVTITGTMASYWKNALPDLSGTTYYRKIILQQ